MLTIVDVKFQEWGKTYSFDTQSLDLKKTDKVIIETDGGLCCALVKKDPYECEDISNSKAPKKILRKVTEEDLMQIERNKEKEKDAFDRCQEVVKTMALNMKLVNVEYLFDSSKAIFYFTADERVDFRELAKELAHQLHIRIEMKQIGVRDEAKKKGAIGPCGRLLCCSTWITEFAPVSVKMAKAQNLSLNPSNISGMCGRLMCCLAYEYQTYVDGYMKKPARDSEKGDDVKEETALQAEEASEETSIKSKVSERQETNTGRFQEKKTGEKKPEGKKDKRHRSRRRRNRSRKKEK
jgi:cell fate regulator YaaT (PSP1 superfamily)